MLSCFPWALVELTKAQIESQNLRDRSPLSEEFPAWSQAKSDQEDLPLKVLFLSKFTLTPIDVKVNLAPSVN